MTPLTDEENRKHEISNHCHICNEKFIQDKENEKYRENCKVRDHCHYSEVLHIVNAIYNTKYQRKSL